MNSGQIVQPRPFRLIHCRNQRCQKKRHCRVQSGQRRPKLERRLVENSAERIVEAQQITMFIHTGSLIYRAQRPPLGQVFPYQELKKFVNTLAISFLGKKFVNIHLRKSFVNNVERHKRKCQVIAIGSKLKLEGVQTPWFCKSIFFFTGPGGLTISPIAPEALRPCIYTINKSSNVPITLKNAPVPRSNYRSP